MNENIIFSLNETEYEGNESLNIDIIKQLLNNYDGENINNDNVKHDNMYSQIVNYKENYTINQLYQICEYYGITKEMKLNRYKKDEVIAVLVKYENLIEKTEIVLKRKQMWHHITELKNDKFMKKYVLWHF